MKFDPEINPILDYISSKSEPEPTRTYSFKEGIKLFEEKKFFECHEVFEFQWRKETGNWKLYTQAIIQLAISLNKVYNKPNIRGSRMQAEKSLDKLNRISELDLTQNGIKVIENLKENLKILLSCHRTEIPDYSIYTPPKLSCETDNIFIKI